MSFSVSYTKAKSQEEAYQLVKDRITPEYIAKWKVKASLDYCPVEKIVATGKGFTLTMKFHEDHSEIDMKLGLLLKPLKNKINSELQKQIERTL